jgi:hypothetical protein
MVCAAAKRSYCHQTLEVAHGWGADWDLNRRCGAGGGETTMTDDGFIEEINTAYRRLGAAAEDLARADRELSEHVRRVRLDNAEAILEAKNERTARLYLDGLLDTEEHRRLEADRARAELDLQHARLEVERLHLIVRLLGTQAGEGTRG